jgi:uncharacterized membrane protein
MINLRKEIISSFIHKHKSLFAVIIMLFIAAFFRLWQITQLPGGLFPDEAANGLDINSILGGDRSPFFERGNGREGLFFYLLAVSVEFFGRGPWQHHIVSALIGIAEVLATFFLTRRMFGFKAAALASFFMAASTWHIVLSRTAFRAIMIPLFTTLTFYYVIKFIQDKTDRQKIYSAILAGAFFAMGFYTYIAYRIMVPIFLGLLAAFACVRFRKYRQNPFDALRSCGKYIAVAAISFMIFIYPLAHYFYTHPGSFVGRSGQVSVFSPALNKVDLAGTIADVIEKTALSFFTEGDLNWRHNVSGEPFLPPIVSILFLTGFLYSLWRSSVYILKRTDFRDGKYLIIVLWFLGMLLPEITTAEGIPHGLRLIGVIPAVFIFPAVALGKILDWLQKNFSRSLGRNAINGLTAAFLSAFLAIILLNSYNLYFKFYANSPEAYYAYRSDLTNVSDYLNRRNNKSQTYLSLDKFSEQTVLYFTTETNNPYQLVTPEKSYEAELKRGDQIVFTQSTLFDIVKFKEHRPFAKLVYEEKNKFGETIMKVFEE